MTYIYACLIQPKDITVDVSIWLKMMELKILMKTYHHTKTFTGHFKWPYSRATAVCNNYSK